MTKERNDFIRNTRQEIIDKRTGGFDTTKLSKSKQKLLNDRLNYIYKDKKDIKDLHTFNLTEGEIQSRKEKDELLKSSMFVINKSIDAKRLIEGVMEKIHNNKEMIEEITERRQLQGHVYKAYKNLFEKGKQVDEQTIIKKKIKNPEQLYDHVYFKLSKNSKHVKKLQYHPFLNNDE
jgi:hypothetical protein